MNQIKKLSTALAVLSLGAFAPGCSPQLVETFGRLCAAAENGQEHCVSSNQGPAAAWTQAEADGELPIQMWARRPKDVTLDQLVESRARLNAWFVDTDRAHAYVRDTKKNAEFVPGEPGRQQRLAAR